MPQHTWAYQDFPYRGTAPALIDLLGGQVQMMCDNISTSIEHIRAGKLRALAVQKPTIPNNEKG